VIGKKGILGVGWGGEITRAVIFDDPDWRAPEFTFDGKEACRLMVKDLFDALDTGGEPELSYQKALRSSEIIFALYESARRRARVDLPLEIDDNPFHAMLEAGAWEQVTQRKS
jgi:hypothetical protein